MKYFTLALLLLLCLDVNAGEIVRSPAAVAAFKRTHPCPTTNLIQKSCPGYVVDHIIPLCAGGADSPTNMQWQDKAAGLQKDKLEWWLCRHLKQCNKV